MVGREYGKSLCLLDSSAMYPKSLCAQLSREEPKYFVLFNWNSFSS